MSNNIHHSRTIYKWLVSINIYRDFSHIVAKHISAIIMSVFLVGFRGKTVQFSQVSTCHRTTIAHFLNAGKWDSNHLEEILKKQVLDRIYGEAERTGKPVYCYVDDTISSKTKPSSKALHPIQDAYFHQSHLKKKQDYGHQAVSVMLSCNGITLNYAIIMYDKTKSKIQIVQDIASELPNAPTVSYFLCDSWYTCAKIVSAFREKGFYTVGAFKTNRIVSLKGGRLQIGQLSAALQLAGLNADLVTVGKRQFYIYHCKVHVEDIGEVIVLLSYPREAFGDPTALRAFLCTDTSLACMDILDHYIVRWNIEVFFRDAKQKLAFDKYQIRSSIGIKRFWLLMSMTHFLCCTGSGEVLSFEDGYAFFQRELLKERTEFIYRCGYAHIPLEKVLALVA